MMNALERNNAIDNPSRALNQVWRSLAILKYIFVILCMVLIMLDHFFYGIYDDFIPAYSVNKTSQKPVLERIKNHPIRSLNQTLGAFSDILYSKEPAEKLKEKKKDEVLLSELLIIDPCVTTVLIILMMEIFGHSLGEPMSKFTFLFLVGLSFLLGVAIFVVSLLSFLRTLHAIMIIASAMAVVFIILEATNFVILFRVL